MNVAAHQEKEKNEKRARERQEKREDRPIFMRLLATLLQWFSGLHGKKMVCVRAVPRVTGTLGKTNSNFNPTQTGLGTAPPR